MHGGPSILVVDDEAIYRELLSEYLKKRYHNRGVSVFAASDGEEALKLTKDQRIDLVISDFHMPNMNGVDLYHQLKHQNNEVEVIIISGDRDAENSLKQLGAFYICWKPFESLNEVGEVSDKALTKHGILQLIEEQGASLKDLASMETISSPNQKVEKLRQTLSEQMIDDLERSTATESQRQLVHDFAHEARGFLSIIQGLAEIMEETLLEKGTEEQQDIVGKLRKHIKRFSSYINQFVDVMRSEIKGQHPKPAIGNEPAPSKMMRDIMAEVSGVFRGVLFENHLTVDINLTADLKAPPAKSAKIKLIFVSLISHLARVIEECHL